MRTMTKAAWAAMSRDRKALIHGQRYVLVMDPTTGGTALEPVLVQDPKVEIAYRKPGQEWKRRVVTSGQVARVVERLQEDGAEILTRDAE